MMRVPMMLAVKARTVKCTQMLGPVGVAWTTKASVAPLVAQLAVSAAYRSVSVPVVILMTMEAKKIIRTTAKIGSHVAVAPLRAVATAAVS